MKQGKNEQVNEQVNEQEKHQQDGDNPIDDSAIGALMAFAHRMDRLDSSLTRAVNVRLDFENGPALGLFRSVSMLSSPVVHVAWRIYELYVKYRTNYYALTQLPPSVDDDFCANALFVFSSELQMLGALLANILDRELNVGVRPRLIKVHKQSHRSEELKPTCDYLLLAVQNDGGAIRLECADGAFNICVEDMLTHALLLTASNNLGQARLDFTGGDLVPSLFLLFEISQDETIVTCNDADAWQRCYVNRELCETGDPSGELIAIASVHRKMRRSMAARRRVLDMRRVGGLAIDLDVAIDCDFSSLNQELRSGRKRKSSSSSDDAPPKKESKVEAKDEAKDETKDETSVAQEKGEISRSSSSSPPSTLDDLNSSVDSDYSGSDLSTVNDILGARVALVRPESEIAFSSDHFFYSISNLCPAQRAFNEQVFEGQLSKFTCATHLLIVPPSDAVDALLVKKFGVVERTSIILNLSTLHIYLPPPSLAGFLAGTLPSEQFIVSRGANILLVLPQALSSFTQVAPHFIYLSGLLIPIATAEK